MTGVRPTIATLVEQARSSESISGATITRGEAAGILASARELHLSRADVEVALTAAGFSDAASITNAEVVRRARQDESALSILDYRPGAIDGRGGATLEAAVRRFQHDNGLAETGVVDVETRQRLEDTVSVAQCMLTALGANIEVDGLAGPATSNALRAYQREHHLPVTGRLDERTFNALGASYDAAINRGVADREWGTSRLTDLRARVESLAVRSPLPLEQLVLATRSQLEALVDTGSISRDLARAANAYRDLNAAITNFDNSTPGAPLRLHALHEAYLAAERLTSGLAAAFASAPSAE